MRSKSESDHTLLIPAEILSMIFLHVVLENMKDFASLSLVCRNWHKIITDQGFLTSLDNSFSGVKKPITELPSSNKLLLVDGPRVLDRTNNLHVFLASFESAPSRLEMQSILVRYKASGLYLLSLVKRYETNCSTVEDIDEGTKPLHKQEALFEAYNKQAVWFGLDPLTEKNHTLPHVVLLCAILKKEIFADHLVKHLTDNHLPVAVCLSSKELVCQISEKLSLPPGEILFYSILFRKEELIEYLIDNHKENLFTVRKAFSEKWLDSVQSKTTSSGDNQKNHQLFFQLKQKVKKFRNQLSISQWQFRELLKSVDEKSLQVGIALYAALSIKAVDICQLIIRHMPSEVELDQWFFYLLLTETNSQYLGPFDRNEPSESLDIVRDTVDFMLGVFEDFPKKFTGMDKVMFQVEQIKKGITSSPQDQSFALLIFLYVALENKFIRQKKSIGGGFFKVSRNYQFSFLEEMRRSVVPRLNHDHPDDYFKELTSRMAASYRKNEKLSDELLAELKDASKPTPDEYTVTNEVRKNEHS